MKFLSKEFGAIIVIAGIFVIAVAYQALAFYLISPSGLKYPNPGHYPEEIGPGSFNCSGNSNCYWEFPNALFVNSSSSLTCFSNNICVYAPNKYFLWIRNLENTEYRGIAAKDLYLGGSYIRGGPTGIKVEGNLDIDNHNINNVNQINANKVSSNEICLNNDCRTSWPGGREITDVSNTLSIISVPGWEAGSPENVIDGDPNTYLGNEDFYVDYGMCGRVKDYHVEEGDTGWCCIWNKCPQTLSRAITLVLNQPIDIGIIAVKGWVFTHWSASIEGVITERKHYLNVYVYSDTKCTQEVGSFSSSKTVSGDWDIGSFLQDSEIVISPVSCIKIETGYTYTSGKHEYIPKFRIYEVKVYKFQ